MKQSSSRSGQILIVGLGNPGPSYAVTRHNMGHSALLALAKAQGWTFKKSDKLKGRIANGMIHGVKVYLLMPSTYMNNSGLAVKKCVDYFKIPLENLLVIADDVNIPFGKLRLREKGGDGGHNGLKSVEAHLQTPTYFRLRMGIGDTFMENMEDFVLSDFSEEEIEALPHIFRETIVIMDTWINGDVERAKEFATNARLSAVQGENE